MVNVQWGEGAPPQAVAANEGRLVTDLPRWGRRSVLELGLGGAAYLTLGGLPASLLAQSEGSALAGKTLNLVMRYRTDPERIARILPPGLEPDEDADVLIDWWVYHPLPGQEDLFRPGTYSECGIHVTARYQGQRGMFQVSMPLDQEWGRSKGRENVGLVKKDGTPRIRREGNVVTADLTRRGKQLYRIQTQIIDQPAHPLYWHRETGYGAFLYRYRLNPDWRQGPLGRDPVELWLRVLGGKTGQYPVQPVTAGPRQCDFDQTHFEFGDPSPLDPLSELPLRSIVGMSYAETGLASEDALAYRRRAPRTQSRIERLQLIDPERFEPWALFNYDRPISNDRAWIPSGWPKRNTAFKLTASELERYRQREALEFHAADLLDIRLAVDATVHRRSLPPGVDPGAEPQIRIVSARLDHSDLSTVPFSEIWLLSRCLLDGKEAWYALSHIVGEGGDVVFGRETFGYPSKMGSVSWQQDGGGLRLVGERMGRSFVEVSARAAGEESAETTDAWTLIGLRLHPPYRRMTAQGFQEPGAEADLIAQPWAISFGQAFSIAPADLRLAFPEEPGPGKIGKPDPWYEFKTGHVVAATLGQATIRRKPGSDLGLLARPMRYLIERYDGAASEGQAASGEVAHTFQIESQPE